jgi:hypothetical protein
MVNTCIVFNINSGTDRFSKGKKSAPVLSHRSGRNLNEKMKKKLNHFCDKFVSAVFEFVASEEKKIERESVVIPSEEVKKLVCFCNTGNYLSMTK